MSTEFTVGWVLRSSTVGFAVGCRIIQPNTPHFGDLVTVHLEPEAVDLYGIVYNVEVHDDPAVRQLILTGEIEPEVILDQRQNRLVPIELSVLVIGYQQYGRLVQGLPPQPPLSLNAIEICDDEDIRRFTESFDYLRLMLNAPQVPVDELIIANLQRAALAQPESQRYGFLVGAGKALARLLHTDLVRLEGILKRIKMVTL
ncbi:hypothetical protein QUF64_04850 [Anaerolineales bacterium HSG6]|nr:hypothetical protein [Anaerolineales bacterium HSG6]